MRVCTCLLIRTQLASVNRSGVTAVNAVLGVLADMGHVHALQRLLRLAVGLGAYNEHTYASAFRGLYRAGRLGMALAAFEEACRCVRACLGVWARGGGGACGVGWGGGSFG